MWKLILMLNLCVEFGRSGVIYGPQNAVAVVGQRKEIKCETDSNSTIIREWSRSSMQGPFTSENEIIFTNRKDRMEINNPHFGIVERKSNSIVLYTNSTEMNDSGIYTCTVQATGKQQAKYSAHLIVFETEPCCQTNLSTFGNNTFEEGTSIWMRCTVYFRGNWAPTIEWRLHECNGSTDEERSDLTDEANVIIAPNACISSSLTIILNGSINASCYSCKIYFKSEHSNHMVTANNTPDYNYEWMSPLVTSFPKTVISPTQPKGFTTELNVSTCNVFNAIYLVGGVAVLFGIISSMIAIILCLRLRRKNSVSMARINSTTVEESEYDMIHQARPDSYETIEEVNARDEILCLDFPPRHGPLPTPGYAGLMSDEPKPVGIYLRMDRKKGIVGESDVDGNDAQSDIDGSNPGLSNIPEMVTPAGAGQSNMNNYVQDPIQDYEHHPTYLTPRDIE